MKKLVALTIIMMFALSFFSPVVFAEESDFTKISNEVNKTNIEIDEMINKAADQADKEILNYTESLEKITSNVENQKNRNIELLNEKIDLIISDLISEVNKKAEKMKERAAKYGFIVNYQLVEVEIGGQNVLIDPLIIAGF